MSTKIASVQRPTLFLLFSGVLVAVAAPLLFALPAQAECWYEGMSFETGERVGSSICMPDGSWKAE